MSFFLKNNILVILLRKKQSGHLPQRPSWSYFLKRWKSPLSIWNGLRWNHPILFSTELYLRKVYYFFDQLVLRLFLIRYVRFIFFKVSGHKYGLLYTYGLFKIIKKIISKFDFLMFLLNLRQYRTLFLVLPGFKCLVKRTFVRNR